MVKSTPSSKTDREQHLDPARRGHSKDSSTESKGISGFLQETRAELAKIAWPSRRQLVSESIGVLLIVLAFASFIYLVDQLFSWVATQLFS
ncbi:preprotein translocase subunit SecE [Synechococcus sp. R70.1]|uniref:preprotein translocase subunit SecE n=1 Tax=Synechococcus sp. R70.1 TaxID=2964531 RepID=UPI0039C407B4